MDGNNKEKTISIIITSAIIFLFCCFYLFKFSFSYTIMFIIMFVIILIMINYFFNNTIYESLNKVFPDTFKSILSKNILPVYLILFVVLLLMYLYELYYPSFINNKYYPLYIAFAISLISFILYTIVNKFDDLNYSEYIHLFAIHLILIVFIFIILFSLYYATINSNIVFISIGVAILLSFLLILYFNPEFIQNLNNTFFDWLYGGTPTANFFMKIYDTIKFEINNNSSLIWLILIIQVILLYFFFYGNDLSHNIIKLLTHDGRMLLNKVMYLDKKASLGKISQFRNYNENDENDEYNYAISGWFYLNPQYNNENYVDIFNYGNNPLISYKGSDNSLQISFEGLKEDGSENNSTEPINIIINNFEFQKWNNIVINCRSGQHIDIFINTKLVASEKIVIGKFDNEKNIEIGDSDLRGAACNIVYYNRTLPIWSIYLSYYIYSSMEIPYISISKDKEDKEKNKNLEDRDFKTESELTQERNKKLEDKYNNDYERNGRGNIVISDEEKLKNVPGTHKVNNLLWFKFFS